MRDVRKKKGAGLSTEKYRLQPCVGTGSVQKQQKNWIIDMTMIMLVCLASILSANCSETTAGTVIKVKTKISLTECNALAILIETDPRALRVIGDDRYLRVRCQL